MGLVKLEILDGEIIVPKTMDELKTFEENL